MEAAGCSWQFHEYTICLMTLMTELVPQKHSGLIAFWSFEGIVPDVLWMLETTADGCDGQ